jgi:hypothetical protein
VPGGNPLIALHADIFWGRYGARKRVYVAVDDVIGVQPVPLPSFMKLLGALEIPPEKGDITRPRDVFNKCAELSECRVDPIDSFAFFEQLGAVSAKRLDTPYIAAFMLKHSDGCPWGYEPHHSEPKGLT